MRRHRLPIVATACLAALACTAQALVADYYVHFSGAVTNGAAVTTSVTRDGANGDLMARPNKACGMQFDGASDTDWVVSGGYAPDFAGTLKVWLPGPGCGAWTTLVVEGKTHPGGKDPGQVSQPADLPGMLKVKQAKAYWIDARGKKLVYANEPCVKNGKNHCGPGGLKGK